MDQLLNGSNEGNSKTDESEEDWGEYRDTRKMIGFVGWNFGIYCVYFTVESNGSQVQEREAIIREQTMEASNQLCRVIEAILTLPHVTLSERLKIFDSI